MFEHSILGSNINRVKAHNLQAVLLNLLHQAQISRVQLAQKTNLSTTTITNLVSELMEFGIVSEDTVNKEDEERRPVGRPPTDLHLVPDARFSIGVHIGVGIFRIALLNLRAELKYSQITHFDLQDPADQILALVQQGIQTLIANSDIDLERVLGVGVGCSGLVNHTTGVNILAPNLGWRDIPVRETFQQRLNLPVMVDNNVRAMALGEAYFGAGQGVESLAFVYGRTGVGAGIVVDGQLFRGSSTGAGEIGHMIMVPEGGLPCRCGNYGCLETLVSEAALLHQAHRLVAEHPQGILANLVKEAGGVLTVDSVFDAARQGDQPSLQVIERLANYLGVALANLVNIINPELILLGGLFSQGHDLILPVAYETMSSMAFAGLGKQVRLETTSFGWRAGVIGAGALALMRFFYQQAASAAPITY